MRCHEFTLKTFFPCLFSMFFRFVCVSACLQVGCQGSLSCSSDKLVMVWFNIDTQWITMNHYESRDWSQWYPEIWALTLNNSASAALQSFESITSESSNCVQPLFSAMCMWICECICVQTQVRRSCGQHSLQTENADLDLGKFARRHPQCSNTGSATTLHYHWTM